MKLEELLKPEYENIVIQCHNDPDADAIASGYGIFLYLKDHGRNVRLVYGGKSAIQKPNLLLLLEKPFRIPIEYVTSLEEPDLLLYIDCQHGERNVQDFQAKAYAVIDHHKVSKPENLPSLQEIRDSYGACSTIVWDMLTEAGFDFSAHRELSTVLYYGLYMDTNKMDEIYHPMDKTMRDRLETKIDQNTIILLKNSNLSFQDLKIAVQALTAYDYNQEYHFAIAEAQRCDPNILGVISDTLMEVDKVDICIAYCMLNDGAKFSVRSCTEKTQAIDIAKFLAPNSGGGHARKAGGFLPVEPGKPDAVVRRFFFSRTEEYFLTTDVIYTYSDSESESSPCQAPDISDAPLYRKKPVEVGYIVTSDAFGPGKKITVRMLEGDVNLTTNDEIYIMVGVKSEIYPIKTEKFRKTYRLIDKPYQFQKGNYPEYAPTVHDSSTGETRTLESLAKEGYVKSCTPCDISRIHARKLHKRTKVFTQWEKGNYMLGLEGDYLVAREDDPADMYIIKGDIFELTYEEA